MKKLEIFDKENSIVVEDEYNMTTYKIFPEIKKLTIESSIKEDCFFNYLTYEYKISSAPVELQIRLLEKSSEPPPGQYEVRDGVVLESEILKDKNKSLSKMIQERISELKKEVKWNKVEILGNYEVNLYILSKHPEIISNEEYRRFLRKSIERIKAGVLKVEDEVKRDVYGLEISKSDYGKSIWYPNTEAERKEIDKYYDLPKEKRKGTNYDKKLEYIEKFNDSLFIESSSKYVGIQKYEFSNSDELIEYIEKVLDNKHNNLVNKVGAASNKDASGKIKWGIVIFLSIIALSWGVWTAIGVFILGAIIISTLSK